MSGIFGIVHLDGSPAQRAELDVMRAAMQYWGPDAGGSWLEGPAALGSLVRFDTPESLLERLPLHSERGFILTAEGRLDNRPELLSDLRLAASEWTSITDGHLILRAYETWGEWAPPHLIGDWSFAAWHPDQHRLFLARDHFGNTCLYYYQDARRFAFASSRKALVALGIPRRLNEFYLACVLVSWTAHHGSQTIELDLRRLPPAHTLALEGSSARVSEYWRLQDVAQVRFGRRQEYAEAFLPVYDRAVRDRLRSHRPVGATLSGGLDSGSLTSLAARALRAESKRLKAYTSVPVYDVSGTVDGKRFGDEFPFAKAVASFAGNVDLVALRSADVTPVEGIRRGLEIHDEPGHAAGNNYWLFDLLAAARDDGLGTLLSGQGGNATISWMGMNAARRLQRLIVQHRWKAVAQRMLYPFVPASVLRGLRHAFRDGRIDWNHTSIHPEFARRIRLDHLYIEGSGSTSNPEEWMPAIQHRYAIIKPGESFLGALWAENGAAHTVDVRDPTFDLRVMTLVLGMPDDVFAGPDGRDRWIIRAAMQGLMPDEVRLSDRRGRQAADLGYRLVHSATEVDQALAEIARSSLARQLVSLTRMQEAWDALRSRVDASTTHESVTILTRGIMAGLFLAGFERVSS